MENIRIARQKLLKQCLEHYHKYLHSSLHRQEIPSQKPSHPFKLQRPMKGSRSGLLYPISPIKELSRKSRNSKVKLFLKCGDIQNGNSRVNSGLSEWAFWIDLSEVYIHIAIRPSSRKFLQFTHKGQIYQFTALPLGLATAPQVFSMIVKEVKVMALSRGIRLHQYLNDWLIRAPSQREALLNTNTIVNLTSSWVINPGKSELTQVFSFVDYEYHLDSCKTNKRFVVGWRKWATHKCITIQDSLFGSETFQKSIPKSDSVDCHR